MLPRSVLAGSPAPSDGDPPGQEKQKREGVTRGGTPQSVIFITFTKHRGILFTAVDTALGHFVSKTVRQRREGHAPPGRSSLADGPT